MNLNSIYRNQAYMAEYFLQCYSVHRGNDMTDNIWRSPLRGYEN